MNRRSFLASLIAIPAAAYLSPTVLATSAPFYGGYAVSNFTFKDIPVMTNAGVPSNQIYFLAKDGPYVVGDGRITRLSM